MIQFFAEGLPKGQPRPRACVRGKHAAVYDPGTAEGWKAQVQLAARDKRPAAPMDGPLKVVLDFYFPRPKSHFGTGKKASELKTGHPLMHTAKPDADNAAKAVLDALGHLGIWRDDAQVSELTVRKYYVLGGIPGCAVTIQQP